MIATDSPRRGKKAKWFQNVFVALLPFVALVLVTVQPELRLWQGWAGVGQSDTHADYRYRFQRPPRGSVRQDIENEIAFYQERIQRNPDGGLDRAALAAAYLKMARATGDLKWYLLAEQTAQRSLANLPFHNSGALLVLARVAEVRHDFHDAIKLGSQVGTDEGFPIIVTSNLAMGRVDEAELAARRLVERAPGVGSYALRALVAIAQGKDEEAEADFRRALRAEEAGEVASSVWVRTLYGRFHYQRGRLKVAGELYREALRVLPQYPLALVNLAELEMRMGRYRAAEQHLTKVVTITAASPNTFDHVVLRGLARLKALQGDRQRAQRFWDEAEARLRRDVTSGKFGHRRELARLLLERERPADLQEAISLMRAELQVRRDAETLDTMAWALSRAGRWHEARQAMQEALRWGVRDARLFYRAALIEQALGNRAQALVFFGAAAQTDPTFDDQARRVLGFGK